MCIGVFVQPLALIMIFPVYHAIEAQDHNQIEAARELGAPWWHIHLFVVMPHAKPGIASGMSLTFITQPSPDGLAQAFILAEDFLDGAPSVLVLGDNIFFGHGLPELLASADRKESGATVFAYRVSDPERYGVVAFGKDRKVSEIVEKPQQAPSNYAVTGLYFVDGDAPERAKRIKPSPRGEVEIVDLLQGYLDEGALTVEPMGRGYAWLDTGTHGSLLDAGNFVRTLQSRQGLQTGCPEEISFSKGWISAEHLANLARPLAKGEYGRHLMAIAEEHRSRT